MDENTQKDRIRGSLIGGAIGDALGYPVEFIYSYAEIQARYGERGITRLDVSQWWTNEDGSRGKAWISDDTQMTLFTACGILNAKAQGSAPLPAICEAYLEWLYTQMGRHPRFRQCWIGEIPELNQRRAPGNPCEDALRSILRGKDPHNHSKGCGGVMRIAPIPLYGMAQGRIPEIEDLDMLAAEAAKLTHQHPLGYIPAALMAHVIYRLATDEAPTRDAFSYYIKEGLETCARLFPRYPDEVTYMRQLAERALSLATAELPDMEAVESIGGGWVGEEAVAIALYCASRHFGDLEAALIAAVNHAGDSDSTGAIIGNILGAAIGYAAIPSFYKEDLELLDVLLQVADDLWRGEHVD